MTTLASTIFAYLHTHWDREWYATAATYRLRMTEVMADLLARLESGALPLFVLDGQTVLLEDYLALFPAEEARLKALIAAGKLHVGPWYTAPDEWLVGGESLIRNLQRGMAQANALGMPLASAYQTGYLPDTFGHSGCMPTLLTHMGLAHAVAWRGINGAKTPALFGWQGPDGTVLPTLHLRAGYFHPFLHDASLSLEEKQAEYQGLLAKLSGQNVPPLLPLGGDHLGAIPQAGLDLLRQWAPQVQLATPAQYLSTVASAMPETTMAGPLMDNAEAYLLTGVWSSRPELKQANRVCEHALIYHVEPMLLLASKHWTTEQNAHARRHLDAAWQQLLLNHPHDSICGCSLDAVHTENMTRFESVKDSADGLKKRPWATLTTSKPQAITVWNSSTQSYAGVVPIEAILPEETPPELAGVQWTGVETLLQNGYETDPWQIPLSHLKTQRHTGWLWVENLTPLAFSDVTAEAAPPLPVETTHTDGKILVTHSGLAVEVGSNVVWLQSGTTKTAFSLIWQPDVGDSYNRGPVIGETPVAAALQHAEVTVSGPLVSILHTEWTLAHGDRIATITVDFTVKAGAAVVAIMIRWPQPWPNGLLQWGFDAGQPITELWTESHLGAQHWLIDPSYRLENHLPAPKNKEVLPQSAAMQRWAVVSAGDAGHLILTDGPPEVECVGSQVRHSLLRTFDGISHASTSTRGGPAGPPFVTPAAQSVGQPFEGRAAWGVLPLNAEWIPAAMAEAAAFYGMAEARYGVAPVADITAPLVTWENAHVLRMATQPIDATTWVLRLINLSTKSQSALLHFGSAVNVCMSDGLNSEVDPLLGAVDNTVTLSFKPRQLLALRVSVAP